MSNGFATMSIIQFILFGILPRNELVHCSILLYRIAQMIRTKGLAPAFLGASEFGSLGVYSGIIAGTEVGDTRYEQRIEMRAHTRIKVRSASVTSILRHAFM